MSSPVLTMTRQVARLEDLLEAVGQLRATRPAGEDDDVHGREERLDLGHPVDGLTVVRRGHPDDDRLEAHVAVRADRVGDDLRRARGGPGRCPCPAMPLAAQQLPVPCLGRGRSSAG